MKEEKKRPEAKTDSEKEGEATQSKAAAAGVQAGDDDVQAYGEPTDASGGGKGIVAEPSDASGGK
jgi:hypothetical protein